MRCKEVIELICDYLEGDLPEDVKKELEEHLNLCKPCIGFLRTYSATSRICKEVIEEHIDEQCVEELKRFLKKKLST